MPTPVLIGGVALFAVVVIGAVILAVYEPDPAGAPAVAQDGDGDSASADSDPASQPASDPWADVATGDLWVVITDFKVANRKIVLQYRVAQGRPQNGKKYALVVAKETVGGTSDSGVDYDDFELSPRGFVQFDTDGYIGDFSSNPLRAWMEERDGFRRNGTKVSGEALVGQSSAESPTDDSDSGSAPAPAEILVDLSGKWGPGPTGREGLQVDIKVTGNLPSGRRFVVVVSRPGSPARPSIVDVTGQLSGGGPGDMTSIGANVPGRPPFELVVEERPVGVVSRPGQEPRVISQRVTVE